MGEGDALGCGSTFHNHPGLDRLQSRGEARWPSSHTPGLRDGTEESTHSPQSLLGVKSWLAVGPQDTPECN